MSRSRCIAVDVMGGDFGPPVTVPAALEVLARHPALRLLLVGDEQLIRPLLPARWAPRTVGRPSDARATEPVNGRDDATAPASRIDILHTPDRLDDQIKPENALRGHKTSSMYQAVEQVQLHQAQACVSAGNTGALMLISRHLLKTIPGIIRPAMLASIPAAAGRRTLLLDVGAHVNSTAEELFQFAMMGAALAATELNRPPRLGLLNIGAEEHKGTTVIRQAAQLIEDHTQAAVDNPTLQPALHYIGYVEANRLYAGDADVIVCDGFTGNVTIKNSAGVVWLIENLLQDAVRRNARQRLLGWLARPLLRELSDTINPSRYNGASILGLQGIVVKSHGHASVQAFTAAIEQADREVLAGIHKRIAAGPVARP